MATRTHTFAQYGFIGSDGQQYELRESGSTYELRRNGAPVSGDAGELVYQLVQLFGAEICRLVRAAE